VVAERQAGLQLPEKTKNDLGETWFAMPTMARKGKVTNEV
jgi:hypothetical protein